MVDDSIAHYCVLRTVYKANPSHNPGQAAKSAAPKGMYDFLSFFSSFFSP